MDARKQNYGDLIEQAGNSASGNANLFNIGCIVVNDDNPTKQMMEWFQALTCNNPMRHEDNSMYAAQEGKHPPTLSTVAITADSQVFSFVQFKI